jgi:hypothetical protein
MGLLDGGLTPIIANAFNWMMIDGLLIQRSMTDNGKGGLTAVEAAPVPVKGMIDPATQVMRQEEGFREDDVSIFLTAMGVPLPRLDDHLFMRGKMWHILAPIVMDTAMTHYTFRGRAIS